MYFCTIVFYRYICVTVFRYRSTTCVQVPPYHLCSGTVVLHVFSYVPDACFIVLGTEAVVLLERHCCLKLQHIEKIIDQFQHVFSFYKCVSFELYDMDIFMSYFMFLGVHIHDDI